MVIALFSCEASISRESRRNHIERLILEKKFTEATIQIGEYKMDFSDEPEIKYLNAFLKLQKGDYISSLRDIDIALTIRPDSSKYHFIKCLLLMKLNFKDSAQVKLKKGLEL